MTQAIRACDRCGTSISGLHHNARRCKACPKRLRIDPIPERPCEICGTTYTPKRRDSTCCSRTCVGLHLNRKYAAVKIAAVQQQRCPGCKEDFKPWRTDQKYCTSICGNRHRALRNRQYTDLSPRQCARCGAAFTPKQSDSILCSRLCSRRTSYARYRKDRVAAAVAWARANPAARAAIANQHKARRRVWVETNPGGVGVTSRDWINLVRHYRNLCAYCGGNTGGIHMDHVIPVSRGGRHAIGNVLPACQACNLAKGAKLLAEWKRWRHDGELTSRRSCNRAAQTLGN